MAALALAAACLLALIFAPGARTAPANDILVGFGWAPASPTPGQTIHFTATTSAPGGVSIKSYDWDFNSDGVVDQRGGTATWSYPAPGSYSVTLRVRGNGNHRGEVGRVVTVSPPPAGDTKQPPVASFTASPGAPVANQPILFSSTSSDPDGTLQEQVWDLNGDGAYDNGGGPTASRSFAAAGEYVIGLRVTDNDGLVSFASQTLTVLPVAGSPAATTQGKLDARLLSPFPVVRIAGRITRRGTRVRLLRVYAPRGAKVSVRCAGRGCPFRKNVRAVSTDAKSRTAVGVRVHRLERLIPAGVQVRVYVTKAGAIGKYTRLRFRRGKAPARTDRCVMPGSWEPAQCPAS